MHAPQPHRSRRWRPLALYWLAQGAGLYLLWAGLWANSWSEVADLPADFVEWSVAWRVVAGILMFTACQAAFVLPVVEPQARSSRGVRWARHAVSGLAAGTIFWGASVVLLALIAEVFDPLRGWDSDLGWPLLWGVAGAVALGTTLVLARCFGDRTPLGLSIAIAATVAGALLGALGMALVSALSFFTKVDERAWALPIALAGPLVLGWAIGTPLLLAFVRRGPRETRLQKLASRLFLGTIIEAVAIIPLDVMVRRRTNCYCGEGTFFALTICGSMGFLMLGPGVFFLLRRRRRRWLAGRCEVCEYDMSGCPDAERCPECGAGWRPRAPSLH